MSDKRSNEEQRKDVLKDDAGRDVNFNLAMSVAVMATASSAAGVLAVLSIGFLGKFRQDVSHNWLSCMPLCFSFITGVAVAYRKQMADVGVHLALVITTLLAGGAGYGLSVTPVYLNRQNCTLPADYEGECNKEVLTMIYFISGAVSSGFAVLGFFASLCACSNAMNRRALRERYREMRLLHEETVKSRQMVESKRKLAQSASITVEKAQNINGSLQHNGTTNTKQTTPATNATTRLTTINEQDTLPRTTIVTFQQDNNVNDVVETTQEVKNNPHEEEDMLLPARLPPETEDVEENQNSHGVKQTTHSETQTQTEDVRDSIPQSGDGDGLIDVDDVDKENCKEQKDVEKGEGQSEGDNANLGIVIYAKEQKSQDKGIQVNHGMENDVTKKVMTHL